MESIPPTHLQGVLAERGLEAESSTRARSSHEAVTQDDLINLGFWRGPLEERYRVRHIAHKQLSGAVDHCKTKKSTIEC